MQIKAYLSSFHLLRGILGGILNKGGLQGQAELAAFEMADGQTADAVKAQR